MQVNNQIPYYPLLKLDAGILNLQYNYTTTKKMPCRQPNSKRKICTWTGIALLFQVNSKKSFVKSRLIWMSGIFILQKLRSLHCCSPAHEYDPALL